jgi:hypothetical protein
MRRNYPSLVAWFILICEFAVPFGVQYVLPGWVRTQGPGGPYLAAFWLAALSSVGTITAAVALRLSFRGFGGRVGSVIALCAHSIIGAVPLMAVFRLVFGLY